MDLTGLSREAVKEYAHRLEAEVERLRSVLEGLGASSPSWPSPRSPEEVTPKAP